MRQRVSTAFAAAALAVVAALASPAAAARGETPDARLLAAYQPVLVLDPEERFLPGSVNSFVSDSVLERLGPAGWLVVDPDPEPGTLPGPGTGVWRLNHAGCTPSLPLGGLDCYSAAAREGGGGAAVYGRVSRLPAATVLQYWLFYDHNAYSYFHPPSDAIWQAHEGDWEAVAVVLDADGEPVEVGTSRHCSGARRSWGSVPRWNGTHPIVHVAAGSHANYFGPGTHPWDVRCIPPQAIGLFALLGLPLPADHAGDGVRVGPPGAGGRVAPILRADEDAKAWVRFDGFWGELEYLHAPLVGTVPWGMGPVGPAYHALWRDPLGTLAGWPLE